MSSKRIPVISITSLDYDNIARTDREVYEHLIVICRSSRKPILPTKIRHDSFRVSRTPASVYIHLLFAQKETCRVRFVPAPPFNLAG